MAGRPSTSLSVKSPESRLNLLGFVVVGAPVEVEILIPASVSGEFPVALILRPLPRSGPFGGSAAVVTMTMKTINQTHFSNFTFIFIIWKFLNKLKLKQQHGFVGDAIAKTKKVEQKVSIVPLAPNSAGDWEFDRVVRRFLGDLYTFCLASLTYWPSPLRTAVYIQFR